MRENPFLRRLALKGAYFGARRFVNWQSQGKWSAWARHSFVLGYHSGVSDLDITLYSDAFLVPPAILLDFAKQCSRLGEWAVYVGEDRKWVHFANPFELERDPILFEKFGSPRPKPGDALAYWLRLYESDSFLRSPQLKLRERKWRFHLKQLQNRMPIEARKKFPAFLEEVLQGLSKKKISFRQAMKADHTSLQAVLRPHKWLWIARRRGLLTNEALGAYWKNPALAPFRDLSRAQIRWEAWGLLGQVRISKNYEEVIGHLHALAEMLPKRDRLRRELAEFLVYLRALQAA